MSVRTNVRSGLSAAASPAGPVLRCSMVSALIVSVLTRCVLTISSRIVNIEIVSVLIIGGWMMSVRRIDAPGRALAWSEMVRTPHSHFFLHTLRLSCRHVPRPTRHRQRAKGHA